MLLNRYKITVTAVEDGSLPGFLGSFLRGVFGETLNRYHPLGYRYFFRLQLKREHPYFKIFGNNPPAPYWFYIPRRIREIKTGESFHFFLTFIENPFFPPESLPVLFNHAFERRLYKGRFSGRLSSVEMQGSAPGNPQIDIKHLDNLHTVHKDFIIQMPVPVSLMRNKIPLPPVNPFDLFHFIIHRAIMLKHLARLLSDIEHLRGEYEPETDNGNSDLFIKPQLLESQALKEIFPVRPALRMQTVYRSPKRKEKYPMRGWSGRFTLRNVSLDFFKLLKLAELIHVGSNTSLGFGKLIVNPLEQNQ